MENFLNRLNRNPYQPIDGASITRVDELGNGYDDWNNLIAPKFEAPQQTWGETALGVATAPARMATALAGSLSPYGQEGWQVPPIIDEGVNALTAVGDAYNYGMDQDEMRNRALGMAGFMMGGGGLAARPAGGTGMFAGRLAKTADHEALARAERLAAEGADRRAIWDQTGWFQGPDSKWRFEIDDSGAGWKRKHAGGVGSSIKNASPLDPPQMGGMLDHGDLYSSYPDTKKLYVKPMNDAGSDGGFYNRSVFINPRLGNDEALKTGLHETQHYLQAKEGFAPGGDFSGDYSKLAGEVEARNVERRINMSADERRATPPWETQDIPDADQVVRLYSNASKEGGILSNILGYFQSKNEPVTVRGYHGTRSEFDKFNGPSVFASENPDAASEWAMVANRDGDSPNVLPLDITASNPYYAKSLFPDQAELDRIAAADPDVVFYPPSTQHGTTFDKYPGQVFEARKPGTVRSATTGETLYSNASKEGAIPAIVAGQEAAPVRAYHGTDATIRGKFKTSDQGGYNALFASPDPEFASHFASDKTRPGKVYPLDVDASGFADIANPEHFARIAEKLDARLPEHMRGQGVAEDMLRQRSHTGTLDWAYRDGVGAVQDAGFSGINLTDAYGKPSMAMFKPGTVRSATTGETLFSNADSKPALLASGLDMGQEARLARARDMGFDTDTTWYHGTTGDFDAFDRKMYGSTTGADGAKKAAFFASDPDIASAYVGLAPSREYTDLVKLQEQAMAKGNSAEFDRIEGILENFQQEGVPTGGNIIPARLPNNMQTFDFYGRPWEDGAMVGAIDNARAAGLPGVVFKNIADHPYDNTRLSSVAAVFDPRNIRSVNAAFDPAKSDSANLLAANADSRPALLGSGQEQDIPDWLLPYLGK